MSTALAIASVTAVLKDLLNNGLIDHNVSKALAGDVTVTALPPDRIDTTSNNAQSQLNLFLYHVSPNSGWRNVGLPSRDARGDRISNPPLALDLHYLLIAYGAQELDSEILLGYGMQLLHETPVLTRAAIRRSLAPPSIFGPSTAGVPDSMRELFRSELAEQVEQIKLAPQFMTTDEVSKLWAAFQGAKYRPMASYLASVVLIESKQSARTPLPVRSRNVIVRPFRHPQIEKVLSRRTPADPILEQAIQVGHDLVLQGEELLGDDTIVRIGETELTPAAENITAKQIIVTLPQDVAAGVQGAQVVQRIRMGAGDLPHAGVESNIAPFVLRPRIDDIDITDVQGSSSARSANVTVRVTPRVRATQRGLLVLNELRTAASIPPEEPSAAYSFALPPRSEAGSLPSIPPDATDTLVFPIRNVRAGTYLLRVQIDGAESPLEADNTGYVGPTVIVP